VSIVNDITEGLLEYEAAHGVFPDQIAMSQETYDDLVKALPLPHPTKQKYNTFLGVKIVVEDKQQGAVQ
jgi:hypothetical protein